MKKLKKVRASKLFVDNGLFELRRYETSSQHEQRVLNALKTFDIHKRYDLVRSVASDKRLPERFIPIYHDNRDHYDLVYGAGKLSDLGFINWALGLFLNQSSLLNDFIKYRVNINKKILLGDHKGAYEYLQELNRKCKSWWAIHIEVHLAKELEKRDTRQMVNDIYDRFPLGNIESRIKELQLLSESTSISLYISDVTSRMKEYRSSGLQDAINAGALESCKSLPINFDSTRNVLIDNIKDYWFESIVDQYVIFKEVILELQARRKLPDEIVDSIEELAKFIEDEELNYIALPTTETNPTILEILEDYTLGNYNTAIEKTEKLLSSDGTSAFGLIELYAKSKIYTNNADNAKSFFDHLSNELASILKCDKKSAEKIDYLKRICVKFKHETWAKSLIFHLLSALDEIESSTSIEMTRCHTLALGPYNTPKARKKDYASYFLSKEVNDTPFHRRIKYNPEDASLENVDRTTFPVLSDYLKFKANALISRGEYLKALEFAVNEYLANEVSSLHLPIKKLCLLVSDISRDNAYTYLLCLCIYDIHHKMYSSTFEEEKTDLFEEFMSSKGSHRPSIVFDRETFDLIETYFLEKVCIPPLLDNLIQYQSNDDVINERIAILDTLIAAKVKNTEQLKVEKDNVLEAMFSERLRAKLESGKLFVDVQALKDQRKHVYHSLYEKMINIEGGIQIESLPEELEDWSTKDVFEIKKGSLIPASKKTELLAEIYDTISKDFALNESYGLDKYLSAEIRHVVFVTQLRACFEKTHLVTSQKDGEYLSNDFWSNKYHYVHPSIVQRIDEQLARFSKGVDSILTRINEKFRVGKKSSDTENVFDFLPYHDRFVRLSHLIAEAENADAFLNILLEYMWEIASDNARLAQELINDELAVEVFQQLTELEVNINAVRGDVSVLDLMQEIKTARSLFTKEVELVLNWFRFVGANDNKNLERINVVIEATLSSFDSVYGHKYQKPHIQIGKSGMMLTYRESRALFISIFTLLENACKYGVRGDLLIFAFDIEDKFSKIRIQNAIPLPQTASSSELVKTIKEKWSPAYALLGRAEGGSGLYKVYSTLLNSETGFTFDVLADSNSFTAIIGLKHESFDNRGQLT